MDEDALFFPEKKPAPGGFESDEESSDREDAPILCVPAGSDDSDYIDNNNEGVIREPPIGAAVAYLPWRRNRDRRDSGPKDLAPNACYTYVKHHNKPDFAGLLLDSSSSDSEESVRLQRDTDEVDMGVEPETAPDRRDRFDLNKDVDDFDGSDGANEEASFFSRGAPPAGFRPGATSRDESTFAGRQLSHKQQRNPLERLSRTIANWMEKDADGRFRRRWGPYVPHNQEGSETRLLDRVAELERMLEEQRDMYEKRIEDLEEEVQKLKHGGGGSGGSSGSGDDDSSADDSDEEERSGASGEGADKPPDLICVSSSHPPDDSDEEERSGASGEGADKPPDLICLSSSHHPDT